jgi:cell division protein FtsL
MANSPDVEEPTREYPVPDEAAGPAAPPPAASSPDAASAPEDQPGRISGFARLLIFTAFVFALMVAACLGLRAVHVLPSFSNPFASKTTDRSQPVLLQSMRDLSRYVAADGTFQVIVDLQQDKSNIPDFLINDRTLFVGSGTVEEYVDFGSLGTNALQVDENNKSVKITLPAPQQSPAALDMSKSYVVAEQRGLLNRIGDAFKNDPNKQQAVYQSAQQRITDAAKSSGLDQRAEANTQKMLSSLFTRLGYTSVSVTFTNP